MIKKHEYSDLIRVFETDDLVSVFVGLNRGISSGTNLLNEIKRYEDGEIDDFDLLEVLEISSLTGIDHFLTYAVNACSTYGSINRCMRKLAQDLETGDGDKLLGQISYFNQEISRVVDAWAGLTDNEVAMFKECAFELVASFAYILKYEFALGDTIASYEANGGNEVECDVDMAFHSYCTRYNVNMIAEAKSVLAIADVFKVKLPLFDEHPELEDAFQDAMGPYLADVEPELLTLEVVTQVLNGSLAPSEVYKLYSNEAIEEGE